MTVGQAEGTVGSESPTPSDGFAHCPRCSMEVRRTEMESHLAHAHNIGPVTAKKPRERDGRGRRRSNDD